MKILVIALIIGVAIYLFLKNKQNVNDNLDSDDLSFSDDLLDFKDKLYKIVKSEDGKYAVGYVDYEENGGGIILINNNEVVFLNNLRRPTVATVSNNGVVVVDNMINDMCSELLIIDDCNKVVLNKRINALVDNCNVDSLGELAVFCTYPNKSCGKIFLIDIIDSKVLFSIDKSFSSTKEIFFDKEHESVTFETFQNEVYVFGYDGVLMNEGDIIEGISKNGNVNEKLNYLYSVLDRGVIDFIGNSNCLDLLESLNGRNESWINQRLAKIYRKIGEYYNDIKDVPNAIRYFSSAVKLDDKVGVKRLLSNLINQKEL